MKKRLFSFILIFLLCFTNVHQVYADAGSLVIAGGTLGTAGLSGTALAGLAVPGLAVLGAAMIGAGINIGLTRASEEAGMTKTEFLKSKVEHYCNEAQITAGVFYKMILDGAQVLNDGRITITDSASKTVSQFIEYLMQDNQIAEPAEALSSTITIGQYELPCRDNFQYLVLSGNRTYQVTASAPVAMFFSTQVSGSQAYPVFVSNTNADVHIESTDGKYSGTITLDLEQNNYYYNYNTRFGYDTVSNIESGDIPIINESIIDILNQGEGFNLVDQITNDTFLGDTTVINNLKQVFNPADNQETVIDPHILTDITTDITEQIADGTITISDYIDIVIDAINDVGDITIDVINEITGIKEQIQDLDIDLDPVIEKEDDSTLEDEDKEPIIDDKITPSGDLEIDPLTIDLKGVFPFCIPYDFKDMISLLNASPVAPVYTVNWNIPIINETLTFTVDLSPFNNVASIMRSMELLAFCIALAMVTRSMFIRG